MTDDIDKLEEKIAAFKSSEKKSDPGAEERQRAQMSAGMRAGSEFMAYVLAGGVTGYAAGHFLGNMPLWMIVMLFAGFGLGTYRAYKTMK
jgi:ATP synthase protein I